MNTFLSNFVLEEAPNEVENLSYKYDRKMFVLDANVGLQLISDVAPFILQQFNWFAKGRQRHVALRELLFELQGKRRPIWVPTFYADFELAANVAADDITIDVKRCGFTETGGPTQDRKYILILFRNGIRLYREVTFSALLGDDKERISIGMPLTYDITPADIRRISFLSLCRLDQDTVELVHHTDSIGLTTANLVWRTDPGIGGTYSETIHELPDPPEDDGVHPVIDPFKIPDQVLVGFNPFGSYEVAEPPAPDPTEYHFVAWNEFLTEEETGFPNDLIVVNVGNHLFNLPLTGSFRVSLRCFFDMDFGIPNIIRFRVVFNNTTLDPVETSITIDNISDPQIFNSGGDRYRTVNALIIPVTSRIPIGSVVVDPDLPVGIEAQFITAGWVADTGGPILGMNIFASANAEADPDPYVEGDATIKIEWWP